MGRVLAVHRHLDVGGALDHVRVGQDVAVGGHDHAGGGALLGNHLEEGVLTEAPGADRDHRGLDLGEDALDVPGLHEGAGVGAVRRPVLDPVGAVDEGDEPSGQQPSDEGADQGGEHPPPSAEGPPTDGPARGGGRHPRRHWLRHLVGRSGLDEYVVVHGSLLGHERLSPPNVESSYPVPGGDDPQERPRLASED